MTDEEVRAAAHALEVVDALELELDLGDAAALVSRGAAR